MLKNKRRYSFIKLNILLALFILSAQAIFVAAQTGEELDKLKFEAVTLIENQKFTEALPILEKVVKADPKDARMQFLYGFGLLGQSKNETDPSKAKSLRAAARAAFVKSKELGINEPIVDGLIQSMPVDGGEEAGFSQNAEANELMTQGEKAFTNGKLDQAFELYQKALKLDPKIYEAALFSGDAKVQLDEFDQAEIWYQKAISIDPNRETAYRYSATPLMRQKKTDQARDRYIEAFITEPYNRSATGGLIQWGQATGTRLGHPKFDIPEFKVGADGKAKSTITLGSLMDDGSAAWIGYTATRTEWLEKKFAKTFPKEKDYRHTLQEEAEALRSVISMAKELQGKSKKVNPQIEKLAKIDQEGLLEAYILLAIPDQGIAEDHPAYLQSNRDKLRKYVANYVIGAK